MKSLVAWAVLSARPENRVDGGLNAIVAALAVVEADSPAVSILAVLVAGPGLLNPIIKGAAGNRITGVAAVTIADLELFRPRRGRPRRCGASRNKSGNHQTYQRQSWIGACHNIFLSNHSAIYVRNFPGSPSISGIILGMTNFLYNP